MCAGACDYRDGDILIKIEKDDFDYEELVWECCWEHICKIRGRNFARVSADDWRVVCRSRGYAISELGINEEGVWGP